VACSSPASRASVFWVLLELVERRLGTRRTAWHTPGGPYYSFKTSRLTTSTNLSPPPPALPSPPTTRKQDGCPRSRRT
jgi:hypothetical protein